MGGIQLMIKYFLLQLKKNIVENPLLYLLILPGFIYFIIFHYIPIYGIVIAFKKFTMGMSIAASPWVGWENFNFLFHSPQFWSVFKNSILLSVYRLLWGFPVPLILAILLSEARSMRFRRITQTIVYLPHFISWVVICGIVSIFLSPSMEGTINFLINSLGGKSINFLIEPKYFRTIIIISEIWKEAGWGMIVYLAAISNIDPTYYEAAIVDGATRMRQIWHITIPFVMGTVIVVLILRMGYILSNGFEQVFLLQNSLTYSVSDIFETYTYRVGLREGRFAFSTAVGLFQSTVGMILILITNTLSKKVNGNGLW
jgi:putative aldouronate transport system permease protein